jgi:hypothetical protein
MKLRRYLLVLVGWCVFPALGVAGPIQFEIYPTQLSVEPGNPALTSALQLTLSPNPRAIIDSENPVAVPVEVVTYNPANLPQPSPIDIHPDGTTHWNNDGYFRVDMRLVDMASGESADFSLWGRAHMYNQYAGGQWTGTTWFWFGDWGNSRAFTLGGNEYSVWGQERFTTELPTVSVWVGPNSPGPHAPEPATLILVAMGLAPIGIRQLRRRQ